MENLIDRFGEGPLMLVAGLLVGLIFGAAGNHSRFCLRAAAVELAQGRLGDRLSIWLMAFGLAVTSVQTAILTGVLDVSDARQLASVGSMSGAIIGGLMFGCGMVLARGCASRLLVLAATGNLRAIVTGLVLTLTAQAALSGVLAPARETLARIWTVPGGSERDLLHHLGLSQSVGVWSAAALVAVALVMGLKQRVPLSELGSSAVVGLSVALGWVLTYAIASASFEVVAIQSVTFTGPSADTLMALVNERKPVLTFGLGLVPGVFLGSLSVAALKRQAHIQRFEPDTPMERYLVGGVLMGFGSMLAGGCAVGAGITGGSIFALTAWVAVFCMWVGAALTNFALASFAKASSVPAE
ncbi:MAG: YeeE/YedE family protein [Pseudomonadota bacterium]